MSLKSIEKVPRVCLLVTFQKKKDIENFERRTNHLKQKPHCLQTICKMT